MTEIQFVDLISTYHRILPSWLLRLSVPNQDWQGHAAWNSEETDAWHDSELPIEKLMSKSKSSGWLCFPRCKYTRIVKPSHLHRPSTAFITWDDNRWEGCISHLWQDPTLYHRMLPNRLLHFSVPNQDWKANAAWSSKETDAWRNSELPWASSCRESNFSSELMASASHFIPFFPCLLGMSMHGKQHYFHTELLPMFALRPISHVVHLLSHMMELFGRMYFHPWGDETKIYLDPGSQRP